MSFRRSHPITIIALLTLAACTDGGGGGGAQPAPGASSTGSVRDVWASGVMVMPEADFGRYMMHVTVRYDNATADAVANDLDVVVRGADGRHLGQTSVTLPAGTSETLLLHLAGVANNETLTVRVDAANEVEEDLENNNQTTVTALRPPSGSTTDKLDLQFSDAHYHGTYYFRDPRFHFFVRNPNRQQIDATNVEFAVYDNGVELFTRTLDVVRAPSPNQIEEGETESDDRITANYVGRELFVRTEDLYGSERPEPGRHVYTIVLDPNNRIAEANEANNMRRILVDVQPSRSMAATPGVVPDIRLNNPHIHQYFNGGIVHFYLENFHASSSQLPIAWRFIREDGSEITRGSELVTPQELKELKFWLPRESLGEAKYFLEYDPENAVQEVDETNNRVQFILDWTPESTG